MIRSAPSSEEREVVRRQPQWLALLESGGASEED
ncbi:sugar ABC transporter substrate-binding protein, partial [Pseudomonas syringae pv. actinidiae]